MLDLPAIGVTDEREIKAIEASALLHDLGKLAIPEHVLNKPGKLTESEFEQMKSHVKIGADILPTIDFPYLLSQSCGTTTRPGMVRVIPMGLWATRFP